MVNIGRMWALFQIFTKSATFQICIILGFVLVTFALFGLQIGHSTIVTIYKYTGIPGKYPYISVVHRCTEIAHCTCTQWTDFKAQNLLKYL